MARKLVTVRDIANLRPIPGSPRFQIAEVDGWTCAVKSEEFRVGETVLFFEIDSFLPSPEVDSRYGREHNPLHNVVVNWQGSKGIHVRSMMVNHSREISQGVILKVNAFPEFESIYSELVFKLGAHDGNMAWMNMCFAETLGVKKWELPQGLTGQSLGSLPAFFPKTDLERVQNVKTLFTDKYANAVFQESVKMDGSSMSVYYVRNNSQFYKSLPVLPANTKAELEHGRVGVCTKNLDLNEFGGSEFWKIALKYKLPQKLENVGLNIAIQGELVGWKINKNRHQFKEGEYEFYVYSMFNIDNQKYIHPDVTVARAQQLGLKHVPILGKVRIHEIAKNQSDLLKRAEGTDNNGLKREGLVYKNLEDSRSFKVIANNYLLTHGE
ncbi:RNA ligase, DRB0094 family [Hypoxylon trugodes]|uniref:RNA ligase, DRB0094 family n=1 Tax=Hypoxylon trugodes TaxID=326681 RepID=UPI0021A08D53|nr:RNA ligase, DRB0094 family [Hypoxylon trugodes]KAI1386909.1 RNA ligase, DRB0094 family [Hypoxylon trugodes]